MWCVGTKCCDSVQSVHPPNSSRWRRETKYNSAGKSGQMLENGQTGTGEPQHTEQRGRHDTIHTKSWLPWRNTCLFYSMSQNLAHFMARFGCLQSVIRHGHSCHDGFAASAQCWDTEGSLQVSLFPCHNMRNTLFSWNYHICIKVVKNYRK